MPFFRGLLQELLRRPVDVRQPNHYFETLTEYRPSFTTWRGSVYEMELTRACINAFAMSCSKLNPSVFGNACPGIVRAFNTWPNQNMTWPRFLYRLATIYEVDCTAYVIPTFSETGEVDGLFPLKADSCDLVDVNGEMWARFHLPTGKNFAIEASRVCCLTKYQYLSDYFGTHNNMRNTLALLNAQVEAEKTAIDLGGRVKFIGKVNGMVAPEDQAKKRDEFYERNFTDNETVLMTYDNTFASIEQVKSNSYTIPTDEMQRIDEHVYSYFGCNKDVLQNTCDEAKWDSYYEGKVEPFALMLSQELTKACYTTRMVQAGNRVEFGADRLQFMGAATKRNIVRDMTGCCVMTINEGRAVLNLPPIEGMDVFMVRGEFFQLDKQGNLIFSAGGKNVVEGERIDVDEGGIDGDTQTFNSVDTQAGDSDEGKTPKSKEA